MRPRGASQALSLIVVLGAASAPVGVARAQSSEDRTLAAVLFEDGRKQMEEGHAAEACPKLEESQRLDPGGGTLLNVALCHEKIGKTATAWAEFIEARGIARADGREDRIAFAEEHLRGLEPRLAYLRVVVAPEDRRPGLELTRNGRPLPETAWGTGVPVDPGPQHLEAHARGHEPWSLDLDAPPEGASRNVPVPGLKATPAPAPAPLPTFAPRAAPTPTPIEPGLGAVAWAGIAIGTTGLASLTASAIAGGAAAVLRSESEDLAPTCDPGCSPAAVSKNDQAITAADVSTGTLIAGGVLAATGATLLVVGLVTSPDTSAPRSSLAIGPGGARVTLRF